MASAERLPRFHLAVPVHDLDAARAFFGGVLGCAEGRSADTWIDWDLRGHQFVTHLTAGRPQRAYNPVDDHDVPVPHFGLILSVPEFHELAARFRSAGVEFVIEPYLRFEGQSGEQWTMFLLDPSGNAMEFKAFADEAQIFVK